MWLGVGKGVGTQVKLGNDRILAIMVAMFIAGSTWKSDDLLKERELP